MQDRPAVSESDLNWDDHECAEYEANVLLTPYAMPPTDIVSSHCNPNLALRTVWLCCIPAHHAASWWLPLPAARDIDEE